MGMLLTFANAENAHKSRVAQIFDLRHNKPQVRDLRYNKSQVRDLRYY
jgi:hypothetical protein